MLHHFLLVTCRGGELSRWTRIFAVTELAGRWRCGEGGSGVLRVCNDFGWDRCGASEVISLIWTAIVAFIYHFHFPRVFQIGEYQGQIGTYDIQIYRR